MRSIWFKRQYVDPILSREKRDTVRAKVPNGINVDDVVGFAVGPRKPFAKARILDITPFEGESPTYPGVTSLVRIDFDLVESFPENG